MEATPSANDSALDWFQRHMGPQAPERESRGRWTRNYDDQSQLKFFFDPASQVLEVGHYSWPPVDAHNLPVNGQDDRAAELAASVVHEFLPGWQRSGGLLYGRRCPAGVIAGRANDRYRNLLYRWGQEFGGEVVDPLASSQAAKWAKARLAESMPLPIQPEPGRELSRQGLLPEGTTLAQWLRPVLAGKLTNRAKEAVWMRTYDCQSQLRLVYWPDQNLIQVGYYSWPLPVCSRDLGLRHDLDGSRSVFASRVLSEFLPDWDSYQNCLRPAKLGSPSQFPADGYRYWRTCLNDYQDICPTVANPVSDRAATSWAMMRFHERRDRELLSDNGSRTAWLQNTLGPAETIEWHTDILGHQVSFDRLRVHNQLAPYLIKRNLVPPPPETGGLVLLETKSPAEMKSVFDSPWRWGESDNPKIPRV